MKSYCICLEKRRTHTDQFFRTMGITPIYTKISTIKELEEIGIEGLKREGIVDATYEIKSKSYYGKIACSLSHIAALKTFLDTDDEMCLIFEDDNHIPSAEEVPAIHTRIKNIIEELKTFTGWYFCNLSPCLSNERYQKKVSENLYSGALGYCMNAYLITRAGARNLINKLPLTMDYHTLDTFIPSLGYNYPFQALDVHPRLFRQKDDHTFDSTLGNNHVSSVVVEFGKEIPLNTPNKSILIPNILIISAILLIAIVARNFIPNKFTVILIAILLLILLIINIRKSTPPDVDMYINNGIIWNTRVHELLKLIEHEDKDYGKLYNPEYSNYRLGDMVKWSDWRKEEQGGEKYHFENFPNSIASEYMKKTDKQQQYDILFDIVQKRSQNTLIPDNQSLVIHLRIGDTIENTGKDLEYLLVKQIKKDNGCLTVKPLYYFYDKIPVIRKYGIKKIVLVGGVHVDVPIDNSYKYIHAIKRFFEELGFIVDVRAGNKPDDDFIFMSNSRYYLPADGGYSNLIKEMVLKKGNIVILGQFSFLLNVLL